MIGWIKGVLIERDENSCMVDCGGLGYVIELTLKDWSMMPSIGSEVALYLHPVYKEDSQQLYGFRDRSAKRAFVELNKANGVGPKMALQILDTYSLEELSLFVAQNNHMAFTRVKGVGPKVAKRLLIDLKGKLQYNSCPEKAMQSTAAHQEAIDALMHLGYKEKRAREMVQSAGGMSVEEIIKSALQKEGTKV